MTQTQLAQRIHVSRAMVGKLLAGDRLPSAASLWQICDVLDINAEEALLAVWRASNGTDPMAFARLLRQQMGKDGNGTPTVPAGWGSLVG